MKYLLPFNLHYALDVCVHVTLLLTCTSCSSMHVQLWRYLNAVTPDLHVFQYDVYMCVHMHMYLLSIIICMYSYVSM